MTQAIGVRTIENDEIEAVHGGNGPSGYTAGPNGEGCTEPPTETKISNVLFAS